MSTGSTACHELAGATALILEDHDDSRDLLCIALEARGMEIVAAATVRAALVLLRDEHIDIIISDIGLPDEDGYSFIRKVRSSSVITTANTPAIALTAFIGPENRSQALAAGFNVFLTKPFDFGKLLASVKQLLDAAVGCEPV